MTTLNDDQQSALADCLVALGDDEMILGQRLSEWCGHAPILEEDIACANLALDEIGHANLWYALAAELRGQDPATYPDHLVYQRPAAAYRCCQLVELPNGDWAFSTLRQCLFDLHEQVQLEKLSASAYAPLAAAAAKIRKEEIYHARHSRAWLRRLGLGTQESHQRMQAALQILWPFTAQLNQPLPGEAVLSAAGILPLAETQRPDWEALVLPLLEECALAIPADPPLVLSRAHHTTGFATLLAELQYLTRLYPDAAW